MMESVAWFSLSSILAASFQSPGIFLSWLMDELGRQPVVNDMQFLYKKTPNLSKWHFFFSGIHKEINQIALHFQEDLGTQTTLCSYITMIK